MVKVKEFVSMQITYNHPVGIDIDRDGKVDPYRMDNADELGELEVVGWEVSPDTGRMTLLAASDETVDLVSAELPRGIEFSGRW